MCAKKKNKESSDFLHYLKDELSMQERHDLERDLQAESFEREAMEGLESITPEKAEEDILSLHASLNRRLKRRKRRTWYSIAATAASILLVGTIFLNIYDFNPDDAESEALTEETFRKLGSGEKPAEPQPETQQPSEPQPETQQPPEPEAKAAMEPEAQADMEPEAPTAIEPEAQPVPALNEEALAKKKPAGDETPAPLAAAAQEDIPEEIPEENPEEILAVEASPKRIKQSASREKMAAPAAYEPENALAAQPSEDRAIGEISGIVLSSEDMEPLPGATIMIQELNSGTVTDTEGRFIIPTEENQATVVASFIGMETKEYVLQSEGENELVLQPDAMMLDEIVVVSHLNGKVSGVSTGSTTRTTTREETGPTYSAAEPPDGYIAYRNYLKENMIFPDSYVPGEREIVVLTFTVNSNGSVVNISPLRSPGEDYTMEASRLLLNGPGWKPAILNGDPMDEEVRIRIVFKK